MSTILNVDNDRSDGVAHALISKLNVSVPIVLASLSENLNFNTEILSLAGKRWVLCDFTELGYDWSREFGHTFGVNTEKFPHVFHYDSWKVFDDFVKDNPPILTFCRELLQEDVKENVQPIQYPCFLPPEPLQTKEEFNNRQLQTIFAWGLSHEYRKELHSRIWSESGKYGYSVCDNLYYAQKFLDTESNHKKWFTLNIPWYARIPIEDFIKVNGLAKISISIAGAGRNCFRHTESPVNSVMLLWEDNLAWHQRYWIDGYNCIKCEQGKEIETAIEWLNKPDELYKIYCSGVEMVHQFRFEKYIPFLEHLINKA